MSSYPWLTIGSIRVPSLWDPCNKLLLLLESMRVLRLFFRQMDSLLIVELSFPCWCRLIERAVDFAGLVTLDSSFSEWPFWMSIHSYALSIPNDGLSHIPYYHKDSNRLFTWNKQDQVYCALLLTFCFLFLFNARLWRFFKYSVIWGLFSCHIDSKSSDSDLWNTPFGS